jgi:hypothetical protein
VADKKPIVHSPRVSSGRGADWFWAVRQDDAPGTADAFVSLPGRLAVHIERAPAGSLPAGGNVENSVGIEKPYRKLTACYQGGCADYEYGAAAWQRADGSGELTVPGDWLNLDARFGLVFVTPKGAAAPVLSLPKPGARDAVRARTPVLADRPHILAVVACPDHNADETTALAGVCRIEEAGDCVRCTIGNRVIVFNCGTAPSRVVMPGADANEIELPAGAVGVWIEGRRLF